MSARDRWTQVMDAAVAEGLLTQAQAADRAEERPWPVVLLTALGAWLAVVPLVGFFGVLLFDVVKEASGAYVIGPACLLGAVAVLRGRRVPLFVEQLAVPGLLVGGCVLAFGLYRDLRGHYASAVLAVLTLGVAASVPRAWLRAWLGALAAWLTSMALMSHGWSHLADGYVRWELHMLLPVWLGTLFAQRVSGPQVALALESMAAGWVLSAVAGLAASSGMTFLAGAAIGGPLWNFGWQGEGLVERIVSVMLATAGFAWLGFAWPSARRLAWGIAALVCVVLAGVMPALGDLLLVLAVCAGTGRWRLASAAGLGAAWVVGAFYYAIEMPLAHKAVVLMTAGAVLGAIAWWMRTRRVPVAAPLHGERHAGPSALVPVTVALCLLVVNIGIWQKESVIAHGRTVLVELAPLDPRSLAQGDYMALNFRLPPVAARPSPNAMPPHVVVQVDERDVATPLRIELAGEEAPVLAPGELRIALTAKDGRWVLVTDAWFFKEGDAARFAAARYGEFRITPDGDALLVGLRDTALVPISP